MREVKKSGNELNSTVFILIYTVNYLHVHFFLFFHYFLYFFFSFYFFLFFLIFE